MSLLKYIDNGKSLEEIQDLIENNPTILLEEDEYLNALARVAINLDVKLFDYLVNFDEVEWQITNVFCYSMCVISYLYPTLSDYQKEKLVQIFNRFLTLIDISDDSINKCFEFILFKNNLFLLRLFVDNGYFNTRNIPECDPVTYYRLKYFKDSKYN